MGATLMRIDFRYLKPKLSFQVLQFLPIQRSAVLLYRQGYELRAMIKPLLSTLRLVGTGQFSRSSNSGYTAL